MVGIDGLGVSGIKDNVSGLVGQKSGASFDKFFESYMKMIDETNSYQIKAEDMQLDFASGKTDDLLALTLAQEKANSTLNFSVQMTSRVMEAYKEIMRMQV